MNHLCLLIPQLILISILGIINTEELNDNVFLESVSCNFYVHETILYNLNI